MHRDPFRGIPTIFASPESTDAGASSYCAVQIDGGAAVIRIEDSSGHGSEGYTFDIMWKCAHPGPDSEEGRAATGTRAATTMHFTAIAMTRSAGTTGACICSPGYGRISNTCARSRSRLEATRYRIAHAHRGVDQLQRLQARGRYDPREVDDVVSALRRVVNDNRLSSRDREALKDDLKRLQDFRAHFREYGVQ